nr:tRNA glutamyl-Q(34) synthetase GluQRS [Bifidobacterium sp. DSM 109958]
MEREEGTAPGARPGSRSVGRPVVGRFAPTPSGRMHLGNAYAMLAAWLSARAAGASAPRGRMILRIEDIDAPRVLPDADRWIMDDLDWLGLDWDGEPIYQSARLDRYEEAFAALGDAGVVYPCFCSRADIRAASAPNEGDGFVVYPGTCRRLWLDRRADAQRRMAAGERHSWRIAMPRETVTFDDRIFGPQRFDAAREVGDTVVRRSDSLFAYQLAVAVDDLDMGVTDIVRGRDLLRSTAVQLVIRRQLLAAESGRAGRAGAASDAEPQFTHLPLIDNAQGRRLAKRERDLDLGYLRRQGVPAERVVGYCAWLLGLQPAAAQAEPMTAAEALDAFRQAGWSELRAHREDRRVPDDLSGTLTATL